MINATNQLRFCPEGVLSFKRFHSNWISTPAVRPDDVNFSPFPSSSFSIHWGFARLKKKYRNGSKACLIWSCWAKIVEIKSKPITSMPRAQSSIENLYKTALHSTKVALFVLFAIYPVLREHAAAETCFWSFCFFYVNQICSPILAVRLPARPAAYLSQDECLFYLQILLPIYLYFTLILLATINTRRRSVMMIYHDGFRSAFAAASDRLSAS